ncbi:MAG: dephospho-CoA kinase [Bacteroidota bacterium]
MKKIGLTGGIGAGKSVVARIILAMGYPVYFSDERAKELTSQHPDIRRELTNLLGKEIYRNGKLDRGKMAALIFEDDTIREGVNKIIHPVVRKDFFDWAVNQGSDLVFNEAAILFETGAYKRFNANVLVTAPMELRLQRVMNRDNVTREEVLRRIDKQWHDDLKRPLADHVILNDERTPLIVQVEQMLEQLK